MWMNRPSGSGWRGAAGLGWALLLVAGLAPGLAGGATPVERVERRDRGLPGTPVTIQLRPESTVHGPEIRLGEIAGIQGDDGGLVERLREAEVGRAPLPGLSRTLDLTYLKARLLQLQIDPGRLALEAPPTVTVATASQRVEGGDLVAFVQAQIRVERGAEAEHLAVKTLGSVAALVLPEGQLALKLRLPAGAELRGATACAVEAWVDGVLIRSISVPVRFGLLAELLVAARAIPRGAILTPEDIRVERRELPAGQEPLRELAAALEHRATRNIAYGEAIHAGLLELPPLVRRGDVVLVSAEGRGLRAVLQAEAREDGRLGQMIRVRNPKSGREIYGRVDADRSVRVAF